MSNTSSDAVLIGTNLATIADVNSVLINPDQLQPWSLSPLSGLVVTSTIAKIRPFLF